MKKKKIVIILCIVIGLFVFTGSLYFTTKLSKVNVEFRTRLAVGETRLGYDILDKVKDSGEFNYNNSVLFINTSKHVSKIEKSNPYVKVQQVIRKFPNKVHVYISERIPKYRIRSSDLNWLILDEEFKVLEKTTNEVLVGQGLDLKTVEIKYIETEASAGSFVIMQNEMDNLNQILSGVYGRTKDYFVVRSIDYSRDTGVYYLTMRANIDGESGSIDYNGGCVIQIEGSDNLKDKALMATSVYAGDGNQIDDKDLSQKIIIISGENGCIIKNQE